MPIKKRMITRNDGQIESKAAALLLMQRSPLLQRFSCNPRKKRLSIGSLAGQQLWDAKLQRQQQQIQKQLPFRRRSTFVIVAHTTIILCCCCCCVLLADASIWALKGLMFYVDAFEITSIRHRGIHSCYSWDHRFLLTDTGTKITTVSLADFRRRVRHAKIRTSPFMITTLLAATTETTSTSPSPSNSTAVSTIDDSDYYYNGSIPLEKLSSMTIPKLKQYIIDEGWNEKGLLTSKLKRKQDIIQYILEKTNQPPPPLNGVSLVSPPESESRHATMTFVPETPATNTANNRSSATPKKVVKNVATYMPPRQKSPPLHSSFATTTTKDDDKYPKLSLKSMTEKLYQQYPPLRYMTNGNSKNNKWNNGFGNGHDNEKKKKDDDNEDDSNDLTTDDNIMIPSSSPSLSSPFIFTSTTTGLGEQDFRQHYHPMLQQQQQQQQQQQSKRRPIQENNQIMQINNNNSNNNNNQNFLSGDMDLIFVGTASCTPSITRGVSCTALRLHMAPPSNSGANHKSPQQQQQQQQQPRRLPGTWLFDCGESTQVRRTLHHDDEEQYQKVKTNHPLHAYT
jgi:hypothetical protein